MNRLRKGHTLKPHLAPRTTLVAAVLAVTMVMLACGGDDADEDAGDPTGRTWVLTELGGQPPAEGSAIDLTITDGTIAGSGGCNTYTGGVSIDGSDLTVATELARTMMACEEPLMSQEDAFLAMLSTVTGFEMDDDELRLTDSGGTVVARFS